MAYGKVLLTGATGHLGANLVRRLLADNQSVRVFLRSDCVHTALKNLDVECVYGDLRDADSVDRAVEGCTHIYHCAALVSTIQGDSVHRRALFDTNVLGTRYILEAAARYHVEKVVVSGSLSATGYESHQPSHENMPFYPFVYHLPYAFTKHLVEHEVLRAHANGLNVVVAVSCAIIGPHDYVPSRMGKVLIDYAHRRLRAYIPGGFEFVSTHDIVEGHVLSMQKGRSGQKYIFSTAYLSMDELMKQCEELTGIPIPTWRLPVPIMARCAEIADHTWYRLFPKAERHLTPAAIHLLSLQRSASHEKATKELGYYPTQINEAIRDAYEDFIRRGVIKINVDTK